MPVDKTRVKQTPCITIEAGEWFNYPGWEDFLCHESIATYADQSELIRNKYNRENGYGGDDYVDIAGNDDVFMWAEWDGDKDEKGRPRIVGDVEILQEYCPQAWDELVELLLEVGFKCGVIRVTNSGNL